MAENCVVPALTQELRCLLPPCLDELNPARHLRGLGIQPSSGLGLVCALPGMGPESSRRSHRVQWDSLVAGTPADVNHCGRRIGEVCPQKGVRHGFEPCRTGTHSGR